MNQPCMNNTEFVLHIKNFVNTAIELPKCEREREAEVMYSLEILGRAGKSVLRQYLKQSGQQKRNIFSRC